MVKLIAISTTLDEIEFAAVLAGLRLFQLANEDFPPDVEAIATNCGAFSPLTSGQIDTLCNDLNSGWES